MRSQIVASAPGTQPAPRALALYMTVVAMSTHFPVTLSHHIAHDLSCCGFLYSVIMHSTVLPISYLLMFLHKDITQVLLRGDNNETLQQKTSEFLEEQTPSDTFKNQSLWKRLQSVIKVFARFLFSFRS